MKKTLPEIFSQIRQRLIQRNMERAISRILYPVNGAMIISLGFRSPGLSSDLPENLGRAALKRFPIWSCSGWGLPCLSCHHESGELLPRHFTLTPPEAGRYLFCGTFPRSLGVRVTNHPALRSSDFPPAHACRRSCTRSNPWSPSETGRSTDITSLPFPAENKVSAGMSDRKASCLPSVFHCTAAGVCS